MMARITLSGAAAALLAASTPSGFAAAQEDVRQDAEALRRIDAMFDQLGGRNRWAEARSLYLHYRQWPAGDIARFQEEFGWRDFREANERLEWRWTNEAGEEVERGRGFADGVMWRRGADGYAEIEGRERDDYLAFWEFDFYTMFSRFARGDETLVLRYAGEDRIEVASLDGQALGWWEIDAHGNLMRWGAVFNDEEELSYVYGPYQDYAGIAFPAWGVSSDGHYRFEYADVQISAAPLRAEVLDAPDTPLDDELLEAPLR